MSDAYSGLFATAKTEPPQEGIIVLIGLVPTPIGRSRLDAALRLSDGSHITVPFAELNVNKTELELAVPARPLTPCAVTGCWQVRLYGNSRCEYHVAGGDDGRWALEWPYYCRLGDMADASVGDGFTEVVLTAIQDEAIKVAGELNA